MNRITQNLQIGAAALFLAAVAAVPAGSTPRSSSTPSLERRSAWWQNAKFGMFIHWGVYSVPADATDLNGNHRIAEWYQSNKQMQVAEYEKFAARFNPAQFNAREWVRIAKDAGMKYITITSKHHDGFCMFGSKLTSYDIVDATPFKRDPVKELADECRRQGVRLCFYYSIMDWHHPDYLPRRPWERETRPAEGADFGRYLAYMKGQLQELLTNYGDIGVIWFDGGWEGDAAKHQSAEVVRMIRSLRPGILINDRINLPEDFSTPEQTIPAGALPGGRLWETCMTMNDTWGFARNDHNWKSTTDLGRKLIDIASKGGNFLLNVGPTDTGIIPPESVERLRAIGRWMKRNGLAIYGTEKSPYRRHPFDGRCTTKGSTLYVHAFSWPEEGLRLPGLKTAVREARLLDGNRRLTFRTESGSDGAVVLVLERPARLDPLATVVALRLAGPAEVEAAQQAIRPDRAGVLALRAPEAEVQGQNAQLQGEGENANIGFWTNASDTVAWTVHTDRPGRYTVEISYACVPDSAGSEYEVAVGQGGAGRSVRGKVSSTGGWERFRTETLGTVELPAGRHTLRVKPHSKPGLAVMNLRWVRLVPVG
jgi:alpha-L-fucosidase